MNKKYILTAILAIFILIFATYALFYPDNQDTEGSKITFYNNGTSWIHAVVFIENVPMKDGSIGSISSDLWLEPKKEEVSNYWDLPGKTMIDLSTLTGYGNEPLPNNTNLYTIFVIDNLNQTSGGKDYLNMVIETRRSSNSNTTAVQIMSKTPNEILKLPENIQTNEIKTTNDPSEGAQYLENMNSLVFGLNIKMGSDETTITASSNEELCEFISQNNDTIQDNQTRNINNSLLIVTKPINQKNNETKDFKDPGEAILGLVETGNNIAKDFDSIVKKMSPGLSDLMDSLDKLFNKE